jgi:hypothetical protein
MKFTKSLLMAACSTLLLAAGAASAAPKVLVVAADGAPPTADLFATGLFDSVDSFISTSGTPTLAFLQGYDAVLNYTNNTPTDPTGLGNVLKAYVDAGGGLVLGTYALSSPWATTGGITTTGYSPLVNVGANGDVSGNVVAVAPSPIFAGVNLSQVTFFHNSNFAHAALDAGATLLATDGAGVNMIAVNASGKVIANNLFPAAGFNNSVDFYKLTANELVFVASPSAVPEPESYGLAFAGLAVVGGVMARRQRKS